jgi:hypothetical protein
VTLAPSERMKSKVEGEGSYTASRRYRAGVEKTVASGKTGELARKAQKAYDGKEGKELRKAEMEAKKGKKTRKK